MRFFRWAHCFDLDEIIRIFLFRSVLKVSVGDKTARFCHMRSCEYQHALRPGAKTGTVKMHFLGASLTIYSIKCGLGSFCGNWNREFSIGQLAAMVKQLPENSRCI